MSRKKVCRCRYSRAQGFLEICAAEPTMEKSRRQKKKEEEDPFDTTCLAYDNALDCPHGGGLPGGRERGRGVVVSVVLVLVV